MSSQDLSRVTKFLLTHGELAKSEVRHSSVECGVPYHKFLGVINYLYNFGILNTRRPKLYSNPDYPNLGKKRTYYSLKKEFVEAWIDGGHGY